MTIDRSEARTIAAKNIQCLGGRVAEGDLVLLDEHTIEIPYGWIFYYDSKRSLETRDLTYAIAGNAPLLIKRDSGEVRVFGTAQPTEWYVEQYEQGLAK
jgi:hypothetical protein